MVKQRLLVLLQFVEVQLIVVQDAVLVAPSTHSLTTFLPPGMGELYLGYQATPDDNYGNDAYGLYIVPKSSGNPKPDEN